MKLLDDMKSLYKQCESSYYDMPEEEAIKVHTTSDVLLSEINDFGNVYNSDGALFLARPITTPKDLAGEYLFSQFEPQDGLPRVFCFTNNSVIKEVKHILPGTLEQITQTPLTLQEYFRNIPLLKVLRGQVVPKVFAVYNDGVQVVQPQFFSGEYQIPEQIIQKAEEAGVAYEMIIGMETKRLKCDLIQTKKHIVEVIHTCIEISEETLDLEEFLNYIEKL